MSVKTMVTRASVYARLEAILARVQLLVSLVPWGRFPCSAE